MSRNPEADEVWRAMTALVTDNRDSWSERPSTRRAYLSVASGYCSGCPAGR